MAKHSNEPLSPGDRIEFSLTAGIKKRGGDYWVKVGAETVIRPGETADEAHDRINIFVIDKLDDATSQLD